jgi:hypothetical protein
MAGKKKVLGRSPTTAKKRPSRTAVWRNEPRAELKQVGPEAPYGAERNLDGKTEQ